MVHLEASENKDVIFYSIQIHMLLSAGDSCRVQSTVLCRWCLLEETPGEDLGSAFRNGQDLDRAGREGLSLDCSDFKGQFRPDDMGHGELASTVMGLGFGAHRKWLQRLAS